LMALGVTTATLNGPSDPVGPASCVGPQAVTKTAASNNKTTNLPNFFIFSS